MNLDEYKELKVKKLEADEILNERISRSLYSLDSVSEIKDY